MQGRAERYTSFEDSAQSFCFERFQTLDVSRKREGEDAIDGNTAFEKATRDSGDERELY